MALNLLTDIIGVNTKGEICHPYEHVRRPHAGLFSYTLLTNDEFSHCTEAELREMIEKGIFNHKGRIRMVPASDITTVRNAALSLKKYKGKLTPI